jgi:DNA topoisomerase I
MRARLRQLSLASAVMARFAATLEQWKFARERYTPAENIALNWLIADPGSTADDLAREAKDSGHRELWDSVTRQMISVADVIEALERFAPKPVHGGDIKVYHATDKQTALALLKRGLIPETKPRPPIDDFEYQPGRGLDLGLYVGASPRDVDGYGRVILEVVVPKKLLEVPTELAQLGETDPMKALRSHDGAIINHRLPGDAFRILPDGKLAALKVAARHQLVTAARYQEKKEVPKANGRGTTEVYVYSERQVQKRNRDKAKRLQKFKGMVEKLRAKVKADLGSEDRETRLTALAVALIDETHERVGNEASAKGERNDSGEPHYGVTGWKKRHITLGSGSATIKYVGKSGVKQEKTVKTPYILSALRRALKDAEGKEGCIFSWDGGSVTADEVNQYLKEFDVTAKDLRGLSCNAIMQRTLKSIRSKGGKLPEDKKERETKLKAEFKEALAEVAEQIGHEASTLKTQYLAPGIEPAYMRNGEVISKLDD